MFKLILVTLSFICLNLNAAIAKSPNKNQIILAHLITNSSLISVVNNQTGEIVGTVANVLATLISTKSNDNFVGYSFNNSCENNQSNEFYSCNLVITEILTQDGNSEPSQFPYAKSLTLTYNANTADSGDGNILVSLSTTAILSVYDPNSQQ